MWSKKFTQCQKCGTTEIRHISKGLCKRCYSVENEKKINDFERNIRGVADKILSKEKLIELYIDQKLSMADIGKFAGTTRTNVFFKIKKFDIPIRSKKDSRDIAIDKGKIKYSTVNNENRNTITLKRKSFNTDFFKNWSNEMAYVLGLIYTDGNVDYVKASGSTNYLQGRLMFGQKDIELVEKFSRLIEYEGLYEYRKENFTENSSASEINYIRINSNDLLDQLYKLGITPRKSMDMKFPEMPEKYLRHFIRGCWDGDGTVYLEDSRIRASYISGSLSFIESLMGYLENFGLSKRKLYEHNHSKSYYFRYVSDDDCLKLYNLFYSDVSTEQYYSKKYQIFKDYFTN